MVENHIFQWTDTLTVNSLWIYLNYGKTVVKKHLRWKKTLKNQTEKDVCVFPNYSQTLYSAKYIHVYYYMLKWIYKMYFLVLINRTLLYNSSGRTTYNLYKKPLYVWKQYPYYTLFLLFLISYIKMKKHIVF
jgi:hypothetical protein